MLLTLLCEGQAAQCFSCLRSQRPWPRRMSTRRFIRLTNAFSKKLENLQAAVALHFAHYNFGTRA